MIQASLGTSQFTKINTSGKLQMGLLVDKMLKYMVDNGYIDKSI